MFCTEQKERNDVVRFEALAVSSPPAAAAGLKAGIAAGMGGELQLRVSRSRCPSRVAAGAPGPEFRVSLDGKPGIQRKWEKSESHLLCSGKNWILEQVLPAVEQRGGDAGRNGEMLYCWGIPGSW